jgi:hypothetical protein
MDFKVNSRGMRNNNPGNIRLGNDWKGEKPGSDGQFEAFTSVEYGIRAIYKLIDSYKKNYKAITIEAIISRYAPTSENATARYIQDVLSYMMKNSYNEQSQYLIKDKAHTDVHLTGLLPLFIGGIILVENGFQPFNFEFIQGCQTL